MIEESTEYENCMDILGTAPKKATLSDFFGEDDTNDEPEWKKHWVGMPEFVQDKQEPFSKIVVRFETQKDLDDFSRLIGQKLTQKTKSIWHPFKSHWGGDKWEWVDET